MQTTTPAAVVQQSLPFDQRHVFDHLPLSEEQKIALLKRLVIEGTEIVDQSSTATMDSDVHPGATCADAPVGPHHQTIPHPPHPVSVSNHQD